MAWSRALTSLGGADRAGGRWLGQTVNLLGFILHLPAQGRQAQLLLLPQALDLQDQLDVGGAVDPVPGAPPAGLEELALVLPIAQHMGVHPGDAAHLADAVEGLAGDFFFYHLLIYRSKIGL